MNKEAKRNNKIKSKEKNRIEEEEEEEEEEDEEENEEETKEEIKYKKKEKNQKEIKPKMIEEKEKIKNFKKEKNKKTKQDKKKKIIDYSMGEVSKENLIEEENIIKNIKNKKKLKKVKSKYHQNQDFEYNIMEAYKKISVLYESINNEKDEYEKKLIYESQMKICLKFCEKKLRDALSICRNDKNLVINRNIIDKLSRLTEHNKMNLNYVIGNIYMALMKKDSLFDYEDEEFEVNDLLLFMNKLIQFKDILINTKIGYNYRKYLIKFLSLIIENFELEEEQLLTLKQIIDQNKEIDHNNLLTRDFDDFVFSISNELMNQPNIYEQYNILIQNKSLIIDMIKESDIDDKNNFDKYLELGKDLAYLLFNKSFKLFLSRQGQNENEDIESDEDNNDSNANNNKNKNKDNNIDTVDIFGSVYTYFDGYKNMGELNVIDSENYFIDYDNNVKELREKILDIAFAYIEQYIDIVEEFAIQYVIYILIKRIYFFHYEKYDNELIPLLAESMTNLCFFEDAPLEHISYFINKILKSDNKEDQYLKNKFIEELKEAKDEEGFLFQFPKSFKYFEKYKELENIKEEDEEKKELDKNNSSKKKGKEKNKIIKIENTKKEKRKNRRKLIFQNEEEEEEGEEEEDDEEGDEEGKKDTKGKKEEKKDEEKNKEKEKVKEKEKEVEKEDKKQKEENEQKEDEENEEEEEEKEEEKAQEQEQEVDNDDEDEDDDDDEEVDKRFSIINNEILLMLEKDLKIAFFNSQTINAGEKFAFYVEINHSYSLLEFSMTIQDLDINLSITNLTEDKAIFEKKKIDKLFHCPIKILMLFILQFEFDNSYSWLTPKTINYKTNILYPDNPYLIGHQILISKYLKTIVKGRELRKEKAKKKTQNLDVDKIEKLLITKIDGENKAFNCINVKENLDEINKMVKDKFLNISSIFIELKKQKEKDNNKDKGGDENNDKDIFYYSKEEEGEGLIKNELTKELFEKYLYDIIKRSKANLNIFNLYIINGDLNDSEKMGNKYPFYNNSIKKILGFEPIIKIDGIMQKMIFFIQNLNQAQILYYLYKQIKVYSLEIILLINYSKYGGYQIALFKNEEIIIDSNDFKGLNKNKSLDENIAIISKGINQIYEKDKNLSVILTQPVDNSENDITPDKIEKKLKKKINKDKIKIIKLEEQFNKELTINSHVFYLDN